MKCFRGGKQHKFEPRYSEEDSNLVQQGIYLKRIQPNTAKELLKNKIYIYDICVWCGKIIKEEKQ